MPATITTYYSFVPKTPARSSEVNTNFSNYRGTLVPINDNTASASNNTHDLGTSDHFWRVGYISGLVFGGSTGGFALSAGSSQLDFYFNGTTAATMDSNGWKVAKMTLTGSTSATYSQSGGAATSTTTLIQWDVTNNNRTLQFNLLTNDKAGKGIYGMVTTGTGALIVTINGTQRYGYEFNGSTTATPDPESITNLTFFSDGNTTTSRITVQLIYKTANVGGGPFTMFTTSAIYLQAIVY